MRLKNIVSVFFVLLSLCSNAQTGKKSCDSLKTAYIEKIYKNPMLAGAKLDSTFNFSNGKSILLFGSQDERWGTKGYSEFALAVCGEDTILNFWGALELCQVSIRKDTLFVKEMKNLPTGEEMKFEPVVWSVKRVYFSGDNAIQHFSINRRVTGYSDKQVNEVLQEYKTVHGSIDNEKMNLAAKLLVAAISGSTTAREYLANFKSKFSPDGAYSEEYSEYVAMLALWDKGK